MAQRATHVLLLLALAFGAGCESGVQRAAVAPTSPAPSATPAAPAVPSPPAAAASPPSSPASAPAPSASAPPPLTGSTNGPTPFATAAHAEPSAACGPGAVKAKLQAIVDACHKHAQAVCGAVTVHAGADGKSVSVQVNLNSTSSTDPFTSCVTRHVNSVEWECATPGSNITVQLGC